MAQATVDVHPVTPERWDDLEALFGENGACAGCWCMYWREQKADYEAGTGEPNRRALRSLVESGDEPGLLAYVDGEPAGWCSVAPRERFPRLANSRVLAPVDDEPVWSVVCFYVDAAHRGQGLTVDLLEAATEYVRAHGGRVVEGYPIDKDGAPVSPAFAWTGLLPAFEAAGFAEVERRSETRPILRATVADE